MRTGKKALLTSISKSVKHVSVFLLSILLARYLSLDDYGTYIQVMLIANTAIYLFLMGIPSSVYFFLVRVKDKKKFLHRTILIIHLLALLAAAIGYFANEQIAASMNNPRLSDFTLIYILFILFQIPIKLYEPTMISSDRIKNFIWINLTFNSLFFFAVAIPLVWLKDIAAIFVWLSVFFAVQYIVIYASIIRVYFKLDEDQTVNEYPEDLSLVAQLKYSLPIGTSGAISEVSRIVDKIIVSGYFNPAQLAIYNRGAMEIPMLNVIINSLGNILMPKFVSAYADKDHDAIIRYWHSSIIIIAFAVYPSMVFLISTSDILIPLLFSDKFLPSVIIFQLYSVTFLTRVTTYDSIIRAVGKTGSLLRVTIISIGLNIILTVILIELIGIVGAVIATIFVNFIICSELLRIIKNMLGIHFYEVFPWSRLLRILVVSLLSAIPVFVYRYSMASGIYIVDFLATGTVFSIAFLLINRKINLLEEMEVNALDSVLPRKLLRIIAPS